MLFCKKPAKRNVRNASKKGKYQQARQHHAKLFTIRENFIFGIRWQAPFAVPLLFDILPNNFHF